MDPKQLETNLVSLLKDVDSVRPRRDGKFITRVLLKSPPSSEQLKIDPYVYIPENYVSTKKAPVSTPDAGAVKNEEDDVEDEKREAKSN